MRQHTFALRRYSADEPHRDHAVTGTLQREGSSLRLHYELRGDLASLSLPAKAGSPSRTDELWQDTCFELFLAEPGTTAYREVNLAPSGDWNVYDFADYRQGGTIDPAVTTLPCTLSRTPGCVALDVELTVSLSALELGVTAIVRDQAGAVSHWALHHAGARPDFHLRESFVLRV